MTPEQRAREFVEVGFRSLGVPSLEPYIAIIAGLIEGAEADATRPLLAALELAKSNMLDHQGCIMPSHLLDAVVREIDAALTATQREENR